MPGDAESLNAGIAGAILLFEAVRQRRGRLGGTAKVEGGRLGGTAKVEGGRLGGTAKVEGGRLGGTA
jgi:hypothetical protein